MQHCFSCKQTASVTRTSSDVFSEIPRLLHQSEQMTHWTENSNAADRFDAHYASTHFVEHISDEPTR